LSSRFIYGEDIRAQVSLPEPAAYLRECMHRAFHRLSWIRQHPKIIACPLDYPDQTGEFYGYDVQAEGESTTGRLVGNLLWIATAQLVAKTGRYFKNKHEVIEAHQTIFGDERSALIATAYHLCRAQWAYRLSEAPVERAELRALCAGVLEFENHFMAQYHAFLLSESESEDTEAKQAAHQRLNRIQFPA
jgi:hypothetical protein